MRVFSGVRDVHLYQSIWTCNQVRKPLAWPLGEFLWLSWLEGLYHGSLVGKSLGGFSNFYYPPNLVIIAAFFTIENNSDLLSRSGVWQEVEKWGVAEFLTKVFCSLSTNGFHYWPRSWFESRKEWNRQGRSITTCIMRVPQLSVGADNMCPRHVKWNDYTILLAVFHDENCSFCNDTSWNSCDYFLEVSGERSSGLAFMHGALGLEKLLLKRYK